jgi:hypothetical protein
MNRGMCLRLAGLLLMARTCFAQYDIEYANYYDDYSLFEDDSSTASTSSSSESNFWDYGWELDCTLEEDGEPKFEGEIFDFNG